MGTNAEQSNDKYQYGYPNNFSGCNGKCLNVLSIPEPYLSYKENAKKLMIIGQDPTLSRKRERVKCVLMLDDENSKLYQWLFGDNGGVFRSIKNSVSIYCTNIIKCCLNVVPSAQIGGAYEYLKKNNYKCIEYLCNELENYEPDIIITLGQPTHQLFLSLINNNSKSEKIAFKMKEAFDGKFRKAEISNRIYYYSPCIHLNTYRRHKRAYEEPIKKLKDELIQITKK